MRPQFRAAIVTVGSELVEGLRVDTHTAEIAQALGVRGFSVSEATSTGDDVLVLAATLARLIADHDLVIVTGGLGPTHDDVTREAAARALGRTLVQDPRLVSKLDTISKRHIDPSAAAQIYAQALVIEGAEVIDATTGTAPGQIVVDNACTLALLPGPPSEMRPMLQVVLDRYPSVRAQPVQLGVFGYGESDAQVRAQRALERHTGLSLTVLAKPGDVQVILFDEGAGESGLAAAARDVAGALGARCYSTDGSTLAEVVVREATAAGLKVATAESCTGGLVSAALTDVAGSSAAFVGGVVSYSNEVKTAVLGVSADAIAEHGAVSEQVVREMAKRAAQLLNADIAVAVSGIAGPDGGTAEKPVGTVWFGLHVRGAQAPRTYATVRSSFGGRAAIRARATSVALDLVRRAILGLPFNED